MPCTAPVYTITPDPPSGGFVEGPRLGTLILHTFMLCRSILFIDYWDCKILISMISIDRPCIMLLWGFRISN